MRRSPRVALAWLAAVLVALGTARVVAGDLAVLHRRARDLGAPVVVVLAARDLPLGATIERSDLRTTSLYRKAVPSGALRQPADAVGHVVAIPVVRGAAVMQRHLAPADRDGLDGLVPFGFRAVRVTTPDGLRPTAGAVVDVLATYDPSLVVVDAPDGTAALAAVTVVRGARVLELDDGADGDASSDVQGPGVTLLVTEDEAAALAFATANGALTLALAPPESACCIPSASSPTPDGARP